MKEAYNKEIKKITKKDGVIYTSVIRISYDKNNKKISEKVIFSKIKN